MHRARWRKLSAWWNRGHEVSPRLFDWVAIATLIVEFGLVWLLLYSGYVPALIGYGVVGLYAVAALITFRRSLFRLLVELCRDSDIVDLQFELQPALSPKLIFFGLPIAIAVFLLGFAMVALLLGVVQGY